MSRVINFTAGPSTLPIGVLERARDELLDYSGSGMSIFEMSHRGPLYEDVHQSVQASVRSLLSVPDNFDVLLLQGGATLQFGMVPLNLLGPSGLAGYVVAGHWGQKAFDDGARVGNAYAAWDGGPSGFMRMPDPGEVEAVDQSVYLHVTTNETINGLRLSEWPEAGCPMVADCSSDFFTRHIPWDFVGLAYGGVQKNIGPPGLTIVIARRELVESGNAGDLPAYLRYATHADSNSLYNTPPSFSVYVTAGVLAWIADHGGVHWLESKSREMSGMLYDTIADSGGYYRSDVEIGSRSRTNVVFRTPDEESDQSFVRQAGEQGMIGLKGHRSVGGIRASLYAAMTRDGTERLVEFMELFRRSR